ncbi:MAG: YezD family protein [Planctomycetes bacterium]|nr:YezD family protein [Planctomycetota bacterium]
MKSTPITDAQQQKNWLDLVRQHVEGLRFGTVQIVVHDSRVVQVDRTERTRFEPAARNDGGAATDRD